MRQPIRFTLIVLLLFFTACFCLCSTAPTADGNSSQTGNNGITVIASAGQIYGKSHKILKLSTYDINFQPQNHMQGFCDSVSSDDSGRFIFNSLPQGIYNLKIQDTFSGKCAFINKIPVFKDSFFIDSTELAASGFVTGAFTDSSGHGIPLSYVFIEGSPFYTVTSNEGNFLLGPIPKGKYLIGLQNAFSYNYTDKTPLPSQAQSMPFWNINVTVIPDSTTKTYLIFKR